MGVGPPRKDAVGKEGGAPRHTNTFPSPSVQSGAPKMDLAEEELRSARYLCFAGGASAGLLYIGAVRGLERYGLSLSKLQGAAGTSVGALMAFCVCAGTPLDVVEEVTLHTDTKSMMKVDVARAVNGMLALNDGRALRAFIEHLMERSGLSRKSTFADLLRLTGRRLMCVSTNITLGESFLWSPETTPRESILDALYSSMCIPVLFSPHEREDGLHVDGCLTTNIPTECFPKEETIFVMLRHTRRHEVDSWQNYIQAISSTLMDQINRMRVDQLHQSGYRAIVLDHTHSNFAAVLPTLANQGEAYLTWMISPDTRTLVTGLLHVLTQICLLSHEASTRGTLSCSSADCEPAAAPPAAVAL